MMDSAAIRWLLNLDALPRDAETVRLAFERPFDAWLWTLIFIGAGLFAVWSYTRLVGSRPWRGALAAMRFALILLVFVLLSGPMLELPRESTERDWVIALTDRSRSLTIGDVERDGARVMREQQLRALLAGTAPVWLDLAERRELHWLGFDRGAFDLPVERGERDEIDGDEASGGDEADDDARDVQPVRLQHGDGRLAVDLGEPGGRQTRLDAALDQALQRAAARPVAGIVIFSDGRTTDPPSRSVIRRLQSEQIPVHVVPLGSTDALGDLAIRRTDAPRRAFVEDQVPVTVHLDRLGEQAQQMGGTIRLIDELSGETLDSVDLSPGDDRDEFVLVAEPELAGSTTWRVEIDTDQPALVEANTSRSFEIELIDRPLRVLYIDGYPRWEYRYVKNLLIREQSIESSILLLSADRDFAQEGDVPLTRLPRTRDEFAEYDVIIIGDVPGHYFSSQQLDLMRDHVAERGAGLLWIGGERYLPRTYSGTALADVLPMRGSLDLSPIGTAVNMRPTELADRMGVLRLAGDEGWPAALSDPSYGWSQLYWAQRIEPGRLKPAVEVLAETVDAYQGEYLPLVMSMRFGAGQTMYVATDEIWRWRFGRGERLPEQFWVQMLRQLGRESLIAERDDAVLDVQPARVTTEQPMNIELRLLDSRLAEAAGARVGAVLEDAAGETIAELNLSRADGRDDLYRMTYLTDAIGDLTVRIDDPELPDLDLTANVEVLAPDDELRRPEADHELLASLASETGGRVFMDATSLATLDEHLPDRSIRTLNPLRDSIWDSPLALMLVLLLLTLEWVGRKVIRLA